MNIAYILNATVRSGGATKSFMQMLRGLIREGINPVVIVPDREGIYNDLQEMGIKVYATTFRMQAYPDCSTLKRKLLSPLKLLARIVVNHRAEKAITHILRENDIDIVHSNVGPLNVGFRAAQKLGLPHISHLREYGKLDFGIRYFPSIKSFYRRLDEAPRSYSICITRDIQRHHHQDGKASSRVIYNGICPRMEEMPQTAQHSHDFFLYAGRIEPAKGVRSLLDAYLSYVLKTPNSLPLKLAGNASDKNYLQDLQRFVAVNGLKRRVSFLGDRSDITDLMREARAIIIPSPHEGFGRCMPEAMMQGCLAIGRDTSGTKEQFDNGLELTGQEIGLRYTTTEQLASLLAEVGQCPAEKYQPYRERAFRVVNTLYTQESNVREILQFYKEILKK